MATVEFEPAAAVQARALGFEPAIHFVAHPIQNRTSAELAAIADEAVPSILSLIGDGSPA